MSSIDSSAPAICRLRATAAHQHQRGLVEAFRRRLDRDGLDVVEGHGVAAVAGEIEAGLDPAVLPHRPARSTGRRRRCASTAICLASLAKGTPRARPDSAAVGIERDAVLRAGRRHRHRAFGRGDLGLRQQPSRQHGLGERHRDRETPGRAQHAEAFGEAGAGAAAILRHPGQRQAGLGQRLPERRFPARLSCRG